MENRQGKDALDESLRRLGGIFASPSLVTSYGHTTPLIERAWLRRAGLTKAQAEEFLALMCEHGQLDTGARALVEELSRREGVPPAEAVRMLLRGEGWTKEHE